MPAERVKDVDVVDAGMRDADEELGPVDDAGDGDGRGLYLGEGGDEGGGDEDCFH